jgi:hypothetical protein
LEIDAMIDVSDSESNCVKDVQNSEVKPPEEGEKQKKVKRKRWERRLPQKYIISTNPSDYSLELDVEIETTDTALKCRMKSLLNCGATGLFADTKYVCENDIPTCPLTKPIPVFNIDGTPNKAGTIRNVADLILQYNHHAERTTFAVTHLGKQNLILGYSWLCEYNPEVDWKTKEVRMTRCPP